MLAEVLEYKEKKIVYSDLRMKTPKEMAEILNDSSVKLERFEAENVDRLYLLDLNGVPMTTEFADHAMRIAKRHVPLMTKSAIIGVTGIKRMFFKTYLVFSKSKMRSFQTKEAALDYLVS